MEEIFNEVKVNEYKIGSLWRSFYSSIVALLLSNKVLNGNGFDLNAKYSIINFKD